MGYSVPVLVFPGLSVLDLGPMYATDRRQTETDVRQTSNVRQHRRLVWASVRQATLSWTYGRNEGRRMVVERIESQSNLIVVITALRDI